MLLWIASKSGGNDGIGFAIPINIVKKSINDFLVKRKIEYGWLGVSITHISQDGSNDIAKELKISGKTGALVLNLFKDCPADKSGILPGNIIIKVDDTINGIMDLYSELNNSKNDEITFRVYREGNEILLGLVR